MVDLLKEDVDSWQRDQVEVNRERNHGIDSGKYIWCDGGCKEQVANCRCEEIKHTEERNAAWGRFGNALCTSEGIAEARKEVEAMGFSESRIEATIKRIAEWKLQDEATERTKWFQDG